MKKLLCIILLAGLTRLTAAAGPINFSPALADTWVVLVDRAITNAGSPMHMVVIQNTNLAAAVTIVVAKLPEDEAKQGLKPCAKNFLAGLVDSWREARQGKLKDEKFEVKTVGGREVALASLKIKAEDGLTYFSGKAWLKNQRLCCCAAFKTGSSAVEDKEIQAIFESVQVDEAQLPR